MIVDQEKFLYKISSFISCCIRQKRNPEELLIDRVCLQKAFTEPLVKEEPNFMSDCFDFETEDGIEYFDHYMFKKGNIIEDRGFYKVKISLSLMS